MAQYRSERNLQYVRQPGFDIGMVSLRQFDRIAVESDCRNDIRTYLQSGRPDNLFPSEEDMPGECVGV